MIIAFAMFSKIPMPETDPEKGSGNYVYCWFPLIGIVIGAFELVLYHIMLLLGLGTLFRAAVLTAVPLLVTGGIHMDGFLDTVDARSSYGDWEKKLAVLKDPHVGAFAVIFGALYLIAYAGAWSEAGWRTLCVMAIYFAFERAVSGLAAVNFPQAGSGSTLDFFTDSELKKTVTDILLAETAALFIAMAVMWVPGAIAALIVTAIIFVRYFLMSLKEFGGIRGDLAGWFLQSCELAVLITLVVIEKI